MQFLDSNCYILRYVKYYRSVSSDKRWKLNFYSCKVWREGLCDVEPLTQHPPLSVHVQPTDPARS
jgi:hypothetical protein